MVLRLWNGRVLALSLCIVACDGYDVYDGTTPLSPDEESCASARSEVTEVCFPPNGVDIVDTSDRPSVADIASSAIALDGGFYLPKSSLGEDVDDIGFVLEDNDACRVSCLVQCEITTQSLCITALSPSRDAKDPPASCSFCGELTREECQAFIDSCAG